EVEVVRDVPPRQAEQLVVDVRDEPGLVLGAELLELRVGLLERGAALDGVGQEARARGLERPADLLGDAHGDTPQHLRVELVGAALELALVLVEAGADLDAVGGRVAASGSLALGRVGDARISGYQPALDVAGA